MFLTTTCYTLWLLLLTVVLRSLTLLQPLLVFPHISQENNTVYVENMRKSCVWEDDSEIARNSLKYKKEYLMWRLCLLIFDLVSPPKS